MKTFDGYQAFTPTVAVYPDKDTGSKGALAYCALGLAGEAGETVDKIKKYIRDDKLDLVGIEKELGDVMWYVAQLANELGLTLQDIIEVNVDKLTSRQERNQLHGSGDNR